MDQQKLLVIEPLVGIGDLIWHKPWLDRLADPVFFGIALPAGQIPAGFANNCDRRA
jgi:hypothetical protein